MRRSWWSRSAVLLGIVALAAACSSGGSSNAASTSSSTGPAASSRATSTSTTTASSTTAAARRIDEATLRSMLLTSAELPAGYTGGPESTGSSSSSTNDFCNQPDIEKLYPSTAEANASFQQSQTGPFVFESLSSYDDAHTVATAMAKFRSEASACSTWTETGSNGSVTHFRIESLSFPKVADNQISFRVTTDSAGVPVTVDFVGVQRGNVMVGVGGTGAASANGATEMPTDLLQQLTTTALAKVDRSLSS